MPKQNINPGTGPLAGDGESLHDAFRKIKDNFDELYTTLGLDSDDTLNLGAFEFNGSVMSTTDSTPIVIDQATTVTSDLTVGGNLLPNVANGGDLGSSARPWKSLYVSDSTIYLGETALSVDGVGNLLVDGQPIADVGTAAWDNITGKPTIPTSFDRLVNGAKTVSLDANGNLTFPQGTLLGYSDPGGFIINGAVDKDIAIYTYNGADAHGWTFGTDGSLTLPGDIRSEGNINIDINLSDSTLRRWQFGEDGMLTLPNGLALPGGAGIFGNGTGGYQITDSANSSYLSFDVGGLQLDTYNGSNIRLRTTPVGTSDYRDWIFNSNGNLTFPDGSNQNTAYTGSAQNIASEGDVSIQVNLTDSTTRIWRFGEDGELTLPAGGDILDSNGDSVLGGGSAGTTQPYLELTDTPFITQPVTLGTPVTAIADLRGQNALVEVVIGEGPVIESITVTTPGVLYVVGQRYRINYYYVGGNSDNGNIDFEVATVGAGGALLTIANAAFAGPAQVNSGTYSGVNIEYRPTEFDVVGTGLTLTRGQDGGLFNSEEEYSYSSSVSPAGTLWNADGWGTLVGFNTRTYDTFNSILTGPDNTPPGELIMWDTINDKYYKFAINIWGVDNNEFSYTRTLITDPNYFKKDDYATANDVDVIEDDSTLQIGITRGLNGGIYNPFTEEDWNSNVSPDGTLWNVDGWNDLTDVETRTYTNFYTAYDEQLGNLVPGSQAVMYVPSIDKYYAIGWISWTQGIGGNTQGGGFSYTRREIDLTKLDQGVRFADGTVQTTAYTGTNVVSTAPRDRRIETASGYKEVSVTERTTAAAVTSTAAQGNELALGFVNVVVSSPQQTALNAIVNSGAFYDFEVSLNQTNWFSANYGGSGFSGGNLYFQLNLRNGVTLPVAQGATVYYRITTGGDPVVWWNKTDLPGGAGDFRGAVIDYHAYTGSGTIIGTIHIVDDDGENYITHTEVSSGSNGSMNDNLWIVTSEGQIKYARFDGVVRTLKIHWTAKVFYGSELYD